MKRFAALQNRYLTQRKPSQLKCSGLLLTGLAIALGLGLGGTPLQAVYGSDHDDGEVDIKGRNLNLTDLYVFRDQDQDSSASADDLVLIMNTNPRSVARQQYYFSNTARYEFYISRVQNNDAPATGSPDVILRFEFDAPQNNQAQTYTMTVLRDGKPFKTQGTTTPLSQGNSPNIKQATFDGAKLSVFAGLREDPFFFDVEQFFRVRAGALGIGEAVGFRSATEAVDFASGYNVNAIAVRIPRKFLQAGSDTTTFDVWQTISVPTGKNKAFTQVERLGRPAINEGLIVSNSFLNSLNSVTPGFEAAALKGRTPAATIAAPIVGEAIQTLKAIGNDSERSMALIRAFLPDVMRIDTQAASGYGNALNALGSPIRGRMLMDDVVDITLSVLTNGAITGDNVSYVGTPGNAAQGHDPLVSKFPYLALPN